jgi:crossover junction endodeoxyribonuclease ruvC
MIVLGIDPGIAIVGYGIIKYNNNSFEVLSYGAITTPAKTKLSSRIKIIHDDINELIRKYDIEAMAIEELFFNKNVKTAIDVSHARGVIMVSAVNNNIPVYEYTPLQVKQGVVGYGRAEKSQIQEMVKVILNLNSIPKPDDVADGLALAICHCHSLNHCDLFLA